MNGTLPPSPTNEAANGARPTGTVLPSNEPTKSAVGQEPGQAKRRRGWVPYALIAVIIVAVCVFSVTFLGRSAPSKFSAVGSAIQDGSGPVAQTKFGDAAGGAGANSSKTSGAPVGGTADVKVLDAPPSQAGRQVVSSGTLTVGVDDVVKAKDDARTSITNLGGFLSGEKTEFTSRRSSTITFKVPPAGFDQALRDLAAVGRVEAEEVKTDDVTQQVVDLDARIRSADASLTRVRDLVGRTNSVSELANLENEVQRRQAELESLQGQKRTLADRTDMATIVVTLEAKADLAAPVGAPPAIASAEWPGFFEGLHAGWTGLLKIGTVAGAALGLLLPFVWLIVPVAVLMVWRRRRRHLLVMDGS